MDLGLKGRVAIVTGGARGIGLATARRFAEEGAAVAVTYRQRVAECRAAVSEIVSAGGRAISLPMDLASFDEIDSAVKVVEDTWGRIDILVNNAYDFGSRTIADDTAFETDAPDYWRDYLRTNIEGTARLSQAVVLSMKRGQWGRILYVSATLAEDGLPKAAWYTMAKSSFHGLTRTLSKELGPAGILVNAVMPGLTATDRLVLIRPERRRAIEDSLPIRRILQPSEVADTIVFLCSSVNSMITGEIIRAAGGRL